MNLPPDKVQLLSQYDNEKKWELICDQVGTGSAHHPVVPCLPGWDGQGGDTATTLPWGHRSIWEGAEGVW